MKKLVILPIVLLLAFAPLLAVAQTAAANPCSLEQVRSSPDRTTTLPRCVNQIYIWSLGVGVLLALLMVVVGGYHYMTAAGNAEQAGKGKEYITGALVGLAILFTAYLLLNEINPDLVNFNLDSLKGLDNTQNSTQNQNGNIRQGGGGSGGGGGGGF
jgi:uncharacterized membrane protein YgcG